MKVTGEEMLFLHSSTAHFLICLGAPQNSPPWFSQVLWGPGPLLAHIPMTPCGTKLPRTSSACATCRCTASTLTPRRYLLAFLYMSRSHVWGSCYSPHPPDSLRSPGCLSHSCFCSPCCSSHACKKALLWWRECSPALQSRLSAACTKHRQELKDIIWVKPGWTYVAGHCRGWLSAGDRADKAKPLSRWP